MTRLRRTFLQALPALILAGTGLAATEPGDVPVEPSDTRVERAPESAWVRPVELPADLGTPAEDASDGVWHLLVDEQLNVPAQERYEHYARLFLNEEGVQDGASITVEFDPSYETLTLNRLRIRRGGEVIDRLADQRVQLLHREQDMESHLYDGRLSAVLVLEDVRPGDVLEYAYTLRGYNPIFNGRFAENESMRWSVPLRELSYRVLWPAGRALHWRGHEMAAQPAVTDAGEGLTEYHWHERDVAPVLADDDLPSWHDPYGWLQLSDYDGWGEVARWADALYVVPDTLPGELEEEIARIRALDTDEERVLACVRWVQDNVRYLGMFMGAHSYKPYPIDLVLRRRFGDCKDKTRLLCAMLRRLGYDARPALVETDYQHRIREWLPSPLAFDHLVTRLRLDGSTYWIDPTRSNQRGHLRDLYFPDYGVALVAGDDTTGLEAIHPATQGTNEVDVHETIRMNDYRGGADMRVRTVYRGQQADRMRTLLKSTSRTELGRNYLHYYQERYPDLEAVGAPKFEDLNERNEIVSEERYHISKLWRPRKGEKGRLYAEFYPQMVRGEVIEPDTRSRTMPFGLDDPVKVNQVIEVTFPDTAEFEPERYEVADPAFKFLYTAASGEHKLRLSYSFRTLSDHVEAARVAEYSENVKGLLDYLGYEIWINDSLAKLKPEDFTRPAAGAEAVTMAAVPGLVPSTRTGMLALALVWLMVLAAAMGGWLFPLRR